MVFLCVIGVLCLFFGIMFLVFYEQMKKLSNVFSRVIMVIDENLLRMRIGLGVCLVAIGLVCLFLVYYYIRKSL